MGFVKLIAGFTISSVACYIPGLLSYLLSLNFEVTDHVRAFKMAYD